MKLRINTDIIKKLKPCQNRLDSWMFKYAYFDGDVTEFVKLTGLTHRDKLWVILRLVSRDTGIIFALDCTFSAYAYNSASAENDVTPYGDTEAAYYNSAAAADAAGTAAASNIPVPNDVYIAAYNAFYSADYYKSMFKEQENQIKALIYLIKGE